MLTLTRAARAAIATAALAATLATRSAPTPTQAAPNEQAPSIWPDSDTVRAVIFDRAAAHGVNPYKLLCVANKESRFDPLAINRTSRATGVMQWLPPYGGGNAWDYTSAAKQGINIFREYASGNVDAVWFDVDSAAELFGNGLATVHWPETVRGC